MQLEPLIDRLEMPQAVIPMFDGNPLQYRQFTLAFRTAIGKRNLSDDVKLHQLFQHTTSKGKEAL
jgi:hypothetical protein